MAIETKARQFQISLKNALFIGFLSLTSLFSNSTWPKGIPAQFGLSPDNSHKLLLKTLQSSQKEAIINIYQLSEPHILTAVTELMKRNVAVHVLIEGQPAPANQYTSEVKAIVHTLQNAIALSPAPYLHKLYVMMKRYDSSQPRRFVYNHAKYIVIDQHLSFIASENFTATGHPLSGTVGNRGWEVTLDSVSFAQQLLKLFREDTRLDFQDVADLTPKLATPPVGPERSTQTPISQHTSASTVRTAPQIDSATGLVQAAALMTAPDALPSVQKLFRSAKKTIDLEYMSLPQTWAGTENDPTPSEMFPAGTNPVAGELILAAQRGTEVRVLLNDDRVFSPKPGKKLPNFMTASFLEKTAKCFSLPLEARIVDVKSTQITYIHNKGILIDDYQTLVSSINGTKNSFRNNREIAVLLNSIDARQYYGKAFDWDWARSPSFNQTRDPMPLDFALPTSPCSSITETTLGSLLLSIFR